MFQCMGSSPKNFNICMVWYCIFPKCKYLCKFNGNTNEFLNPIYLLRVKLTKKDKTNAQWSYKIKGALNQGFVKGEEFCWSYSFFFSMNLSLSNQIKHTDIVNQSEASKSELVSSLSVYESK